MQHDSHLYDPNHMLSDNIFNCGIVKFPRLVVEEIVEGTEKLPMAASEPVI